MLRGDPKVKIPARCDKYIRTSWQSVPKYHHFVVSYICKRPKRAHLWTVQSEEFQPPSFSCITLKFIILESLVQDQFSTRHFCYQVNTWKTKENSFSEDWWIKGFINRLLIIIWFVFAKKFLIQVDFQKFKWAVATQIHLLMANCHFPSLDYYQINYTKRERLELSRLKGS